MLSCCALAVGGTQVGSVAYLDVFVCGLFASGRLEKVFCIVHVVVFFSNHVRSGPVRTCFFYFVKLARYILETMVHVPYWINQSVSCFLSSFVVPV